MSSPWKGITLGVLAGFVLTGVFFPWYVDLKGWFRVPVTGRTQVGWTLSVAVRPPLFPFPFRFFFAPDEKRMKRREGKRISPRERRSGKEEAAAGIRGRARKLLPALRYLASRFDITEARARLEIGVGDGAATALVAGGLLSFFRGVLPLFVPASSRRFLRNISVTPAYDRTGIEGRFRVAGRLRPVHVAAAGARLLLAVMKERTRSVRASGGITPRARGQDSCE